MSAKPVRGLQASEGPLAESYDLAMLDLDGVVYVGPDAVPGAPGHIAAAREAGMRVAFITNNAARSSQRVAEHLVELGVEASADDVVTSAQAAARVLADRLDAGAAVVVLGSPDLVETVRAAGLTPVGAEDDEAESAEAVVTGYGPDVLWRQIMRAAVRIADGTWWVATNTDLTIPTPFGTAPGHGVLVETLTRFTGVEPEVAGKPARPLLDETVRRVGGERPLMVGDRLDTDIAGGRNAGIDTLLVMTGVTGLTELVGAQEGERPTYVAADLAGLISAQGVPEAEGDGFVLGGWTAHVRDGALDVDGSGSADDWWRVVAATGWAHLDAEGSPVETGGVSAPG